MKTSHYLLIAAILITLTGMVATDVLLKREYEKIDWSDPYQFFARRALPTARHVVITGTPSRDIIVETGQVITVDMPRQSAHNEPVRMAQALVAPEDSLFFRSHMQHDTLYISFDPDATIQGSPRVEAWADKRVGALIRLPAIQSLTAIDARVKLPQLTVPSLDVTLQNSYLNTFAIAVLGSFRLVERQNSLAELSGGNYKTVNVVVQDSSAVHLNNTQIDAFSPTLSERAEVQFKGKATRWVK